jgi:hypothetical protein
MLLHDSFPSFMFNDRLPVVRQGAVSARSTLTASGGVDLPMSSVKARSLP